MTCVHTPIGPIFRPFTVKMGMIYQQRLCWGAMHERHMWRLNRYLAFVEQLVSYGRFKYPTKNGHRSRRYVHPYTYTYTYTFTYTNTFTYTYIYTLIHIRIHIHTHIHTHIHIRAAAPAADPGPIFASWYFRASGFWIWTCCTGTEGRNGALQW